MEVIVILIGIAVVFAVVAAVVILMLRRNKNEATLDSNLPETVLPGNSFVKSDAWDQLIIQTEMLPANAIGDESGLVEITDSEILAHVNNLVPGLLQAQNAVNNAAVAVKASAEVLYRAIIPSGAKLAKSKAIKDAVRGFYRGENGIAGLADLVPVKIKNGASVVANSAAAAMGVASMVVGQYYMTQINDELGVISDGISQIQDFQDTEYKSRVFSLVAHVKKIADFQIEILENNELRLSKISQLDTLEEECTQLLGQANLTLAGFADKTGLDYAEYEKAVSNAQNWFMYQKSLLDMLYKISDLRYTLHLGAVSREQCIALLPIYKKQVINTQECLTAWHKGTIERLCIETDEVRRKRVGFDGIIHFIPGLFNDDLKFRSIEQKTADMISAQASGHEKNQYMNNSELYAEDVQLIAKNGKIYYLPKCDVD